MTLPPKSPKPSSTELRQRAEAQLKKQGERHSEQDAKRLLHELQVNQIELELQNDELQQARIDEKKSADRYTELFEFAPIAYFVINPSSIISQLNLRGASLLGIERANIVGQRFLNYVTAEYKDVFKRFLVEIFKGGGIQSCEVEVQIDRRVLWLSVEANIDKVGTDCLTSMIDITELKHSKEAVQKSENRFRQLFEQTADALLLLDTGENKFIDYNAAAAAMLGFKSVKNMVSLHPAELSPPHQPDGRDSFEKAQEMIALAVQKGSHRFEWIHRSPHREDFPVEVLLTPIQIEKQQLILTTWRDITDRKLAEKKLNLAASVFTQAQESIVITDTSGTIIDVNDTFSAVTGYSREEVIGQNPRILQSGRQSPEFYVDMWQTLLKEGHWYGELWNRRKSGEVYAEMKTISAVRDEQGVTTHYVALGSDITTMKKHQDQLEHTARYDILTNLPNRLLLADRLSHAMLQCNRHKRSLAVVFLDLDGFKEVNDNYGHHVGDELLIALSLRMKEALREGDTLARIGGDEFVAVLADLVKVEDCEPVLDRLLLSASEPVTIGEVVLNISASIGVTLYPQDSVDADMLLHHADQAMYTAKESGKNRYHLFDIVHDNAVKVQRENIEAIRTALDEQQFVLYYQPKVNMRTGTIMGVEALIRWQHPMRGLLSPLEFLPIIENHTMMIEIGEWVIDTALTQISQWQAMGIKLPVSASVNIAASQLHEVDFANRLATLLAAHPDVEPRYLECEVRETNALGDLTAVSATMNACIALGVNFALDGFGTGYSSLTYLRLLPASLIKIDQTLVRDMLVDVDDLAIVEGVIALAKTFKRDVIAEGVETIEHGTALLQLGCDMAQGYAIAKPMPASDVPVWISEWKPDSDWKS